MVKDGTAFVIVHNGTFYSRPRIPSLRTGTEPLVDVFWLCDDDNQVKVTLKANWTGICIYVYDRTSDNSEPSTI